MAHISLQETNRLDAAKEKWDVKLKSYLNFYYSFFGRAPEEEKEKKTLQCASQEHAAVQQREGGGGHPPVDVLEPADPGIHTAPAIPPPIPLPSSPLSSRAIQQQPYTSFLRPETPDMLQQPRFDLALGLNSEKQRTVT